MEYCNNIHNHRIKLTALIIQCNYTVSPKTSHFDIVHIFAKY